MKEYAVEHRKPIDIKQLEVGFIDTPDFKICHKNDVQTCHDIIILYNSGGIIVERLEDPEKGELWPLGGRLLKGVPMLDSLRKKIRKEAGLELTDIVKLNGGEPHRYLFETDPFGHGKGTDTLNLMYFARGVGELKLNEDHESPTLVTPQMYIKMKSSLHPYVQEMMDLSLPFIQKYT
ncbi:hypothetical protein KW805_04085 [Candidatus Pacearchaeota archaeon]|nr:hypothetical protein [Candidatus Pacearchaeota archaeon]